MISYWFFVCFSQHIQSIDLPRLIRTLRFLNQTKETKINSLWNRIFIRFFRVSSFGTHNLWQTSVWIIEKLETGCIVLRTLIAPMFVQCSSGRMSFRLPDLCFNICFVPSQINIQKTFMWLSYVFFGTFGFWQLKTGKIYH